MKAIEQVNTITNELLLYLNRLIHGTKTSKNSASQNIIPHNIWVPVCNFMYTKLAEKHMGVAGAGPFVVVANEFHIFYNETTSVSFTIINQLLFITFFVLFLIKSS